MLPIIQGGDQKPFFVFVECESMSKKKKTPKCPLLSGISCSSPTANWVFPADLRGMESSYIGDSEVDLMRFEFARLRFTGTGF